MGLRPLACKNCGFESRRGFGCLSVVSVVCCQVEVSATSWSLFQRIPTDCGVSECDSGTSERRPWPTGGCRAMGIKLMSITKWFYTADYPCSNKLYARNTRKTRPVWGKKLQPKWITSYSAVKCTSLQLSRHNDDTAGHSRNRVAIPDSRRRFLSLAGSGAHSALYSMDTSDFLPEIKQRGREADNSCPSSVEFKTM